MNGMFRFFVIALLALAFASQVEAKSSLAQGEALYPNSYLISPNGQYQLWMQGDGNLVLYNNATGRVEWASWTQGNYGLHVVMQTDGNLVMYDEEGYVYWESGTNPTGAAELNLQDDGNLVIYGLAPVWETHTVWGDCGLRANYPASMATLAVHGADNWSVYDNLSERPLANALGAPFAGVPTRTSLTSSNGCYSLILQTDNNLVLYRNTDQAVLWSTDTWRVGGQSGSRAVLQGDGNFILYYGANYYALWDSYDPGTDLLPGYGRQLIMQNDGNLVMYTARVAVWAKGQRYSWTRRRNISWLGRIFGNTCPGISYDSTKNSDLTGHWTFSISC